MTSITLPTLLLPNSKVDTRLNKATPISLSLSLRPRGRLVRYLAVIRKVLKKHARSMRRQARRAIGRRQERSITRRLKRLTIDRVVLGRRLAAICDGASNGAEAPCYQYH